MDEAIPIEIPETTRPKQRRDTPLAAVWKIDPMIQMRAETWMAVRRESLSAMNEDNSEPTKEPAGIDAVIPPCR